MKQTFKMFVAMMLCAVMVLGILPVASFADSFDYAHNESASSDGYYNIISKTDWDIAPGITETEIILNNEAGDRRQVVHMMVADIANPYTRVISSYTNMDTSNYALSTIPEHAAFLEKEWGENVVGAMNTCLSWYNTDTYAKEPERVNEPLGFMMVDGEVFFDHSVGFPTCIVIHKDTNENGETRPTDIPKVEMRTVLDRSSLNGWEDQVIPCSSGYIVKDGVNTSKAGHGTDTAARSVVGVKADGSIVIMMNDGRQSPYSLGMNMYECAEVMIAAGCVYASNCDGGGSSTFMSQRPGRDLEVNCSPCDGALRQNTHGIMFISTAPATGEFDNAYLETANDYYTPYSEVKVEAVGRDFSGAEAEIPAEVEWALADNSFGTVADGVFTSNGKTGDVEIQLIYNDEVVGSKTVHIVNPEAVSFAQSSTVIPYGKSIVLDIVATFGAFDVTYNASDFDWVLSDEAAGAREGLKFTATSDTAKTGVKVTATYKHTDLGSTTLDIAFGKGSEILYDFENGDISHWLGIEALQEWAAVNNPNSPIFDASPFAANFSKENDSTTFLATAENGKVKNGKYALGVSLDYTHSGDYGQWCYNMFFNVGGQTVLRDVANGKNATRLGMWIYIPEELAPGHNMAMQTELYCGASSTSYARKNTHLTLECNGKTLTKCSEADIPEDRWVYCYMDLTGYNYVAIQNPYESNSDRREPQFIRFYTQSKEPFNAVLYFDDITLDYSDAVDDRKAPVISDLQVSTSGTTIRSFSAKVADYAASNASGLDYTTGKIYVDGVELTQVTAAGSTLGSSDVTLLPGTHTVTFEIADKMGNVTKESQSFTVAGTAPVTITGHNDLNNVPEYDSVYYVDIKAENVESVSSLTTDIYLNFANNWELDHMIVADGFKATYTINKNHNVATITVTKTGDTATGAATLVSIPVRVWFWNAEGAGSDTSAIGANSYPLVYVKTDVRKGAVTFADGTEGTFDGAFTVATAVTNTVAPSGWHVHTAEAVADLDATCTEGGFTGRTYCAVCGSVVDWGTVLTATGHSWAVNAEGKLACENGGELFSGIYTDGKTYVDGVVIADGWVEVDGVQTYYYLDGMKLTGSQLINDVMYTFDDNGVYQPNYKYDGWYEIDDTVMYFINNTCLTGYQKLDGKPYYFDTKGKAFDGEYVINGETCLFDNGLFVSSENKAVLEAGWCGANLQSVEYVVYSDASIRISGEGDMMNFVEVSTVPWSNHTKTFIKSVYIGKDITKIGNHAFRNCFVATSLTFEEGSKLTYIGMRAFHNMRNLKTVVLPETVEVLRWSSFGYAYNLKSMYLPESLTTIEDGAFVECNDALVLSVAKDSLGQTYAEANGIDYTVREVVLKNGIYAENGAIYYYKDGVKTGAGLVKVDGYYYYASSGGKCATGKYWVSRTNDLLKAGYYVFDAETGRMDIKNGVYAEDGAMYYYVDGVRTSAGLVKVNGYYYYASSGGKCATGKYWVSRTNDLLKAGYYVFDAETAKMDIKNGVYAEDGAMYYYVDGARTSAGLVLVDGSYYYASSGGKCVTGKYWVSRTNDLLKAGYYVFDAETGKMVG